MLVGVILGVIFLTPKDSGVDVTTTTPTTTALPHTHIEVIDSAVAATCTQTGLTEGKHCSDCGEVLIAQQTIAALGEHNYVNGICSVCADVKVVDVPNDVVINGDNEELANDVIEEIITNEALVDFVVENLPENGSLEIIVSEVNVNEEALTELVFVVSPKDAEGNKIENFEEGQGITFRLPLPASVTEAYAIVYHEDVVHGVYEIKTLDGNKYIEIYSENFSEYGVVLHNHSYETVVTAPTCTVAGYTTYTCACGDTYTGNEVAKLAHTEVIDPAIAATCTATGKTEGKHCSVCNTVIVAQEVVSAGHTEVIDAAVAPTCTSTGLTEGKHCSVCNATLVAQTVVAATGHTEVIDSAVAATCITKGKTEGKHCSVCNTIFVAQQETPLTSHTYDDANDEDCNVCGYERDLNCSHIETETITGYDSTCTTTGLTNGTKCKDCQEIIVAQTTIAATGHTEVVDAAVAATCTTTGLTQGKHCSVCNTVIVAQQETPNLHYIDENDTVEISVENEINPSCTISGSYDAVVYCRVCNDEIYRRTVTVAPLGHSEEISEAFEPTCESVGYTEGSYCSRCNETLVEVQEIPKLPHTEVIDSAVAPTCTATGKTAGKHCSVCNTVIEAQTDVAKLDHTEVIDTAVAPTCTATGLTQGKHCSVCNTVIVAQETVNKIAHTYDDDNDEDCNVCGYERDISCSHSEIETISGYDSTCTTTGLTNGTKCKDCQEIIVAQTTIAVKAHTEVIDAAVAPTCTATGLTQGKHCSVCNTVIDAQETVAATGHTDVVDVAVAATCSSVGKTEGKHCSVCNTVIVAQVDIAKLDHTEVIDAAVAPTYTATGLTEGSHCSVCNTVIVAQETIAQLIATTSITLNNTEATITYGGNLTLVATVLPDNASNKTIIWQSSDNTIIQVVNGVVTTTGIGTATITATTVNGQTATCTVTVTGNAEIKFELSEDYSFYIVSGIEGRTDKLEIPFLYDGLRVKAIKANAFTSNTDLKEVVLPNSIEFIYDNAFKDCSNLEIINFPESLTCIGVSSFENCTSLKEITIPALTETVSSRAFYNCTSLETLSISSGVKNIGNSAFAYCSALETANIGDGLETIGIMAFDYCTSLKRFDMPNTVTTLGSMAFRHAEALESVTFSTSLTTIGNACFQYCISLDNVELHAGIVGIGASCFSDCTGMKNLSILGNESSLGDSAFYNCISLENVYYASSVSESLRTNNYVFYNAGTNGNGITFTLSANACICDRLFEPQGNLNRPKIVKIVVEEGATSVNYLNNYNTLPYLVDIELPDTITYIKKGCFDNSAWWTNQSNGVIYINNIFYGYKGSLTEELVIYDNTVCIAFGALEGHMPTSLTIPFVGAVANGSENTHFGYVFGAENVEGQIDYIPSELTSVTVKLCQYTIATSAFTDCEFTVIVDHQWSDWTTTLAETCQTEGSEEKICSVCSEVETRSRAINPNAHSAATEWKTDENNHWHECTITGCDELLEYESHKWGEWVITIKPTCQTTGSKYHICSICEYKATEVIPIDSNAHSPATKWETDANNHWHECTINGCDENVEVTGHNWGQWIVTLEPTCQTTGNKYHICSICEYKATEVIPIDSNAHSAATEWKTDANNHWHECTITGCDELLEYESHKWGEWVITTEPTCQTTGSKYLACTVCDYKIIETIPVDPNAHSIASIWTNDENNHWHECTIDGCDEKFEVTGHIMGEWVITLEPTCKTTGSKYHACTVCEYQTNEEVIPINPDAHTWNNENTCTGCQLYKDSGVIFWFDSYTSSYSVTDYKGNETEVIIPSIYKGYPVTSIDYGAFLYCTSLISIEIPNSVTSIGHYAFEDCTSLISIEIPNSVTSIGNWAFFRCTSLTSIEIPDSVTSIGDVAFAYCESLTSIEIPNSVTSIGVSAFAYCESLTSIEIPNSVTSIGNRAFSSCTSLTSIEVPDSVTSIGDEAFRGCTSLESVVIGGSVTSISEMAFYDCTSLTSVVLCDSVTSIGNYAFENCTSLASIEIPNSVTSIGLMAFYDCTFLTSINIPDSVTSIGDYAFGHCWSLTSINIPDSVTSIGDYAFSSCFSLSSVVLGDSVTSIGNYAFETCTSLASIEIPNSVTSIGDDAFGHCWSLTSINIPDSVTSIGDRVFYYCISLTSIEIPDSVTSIGGGAFYCCELLTSVVIGDSVTSIGDYAFYGCASLISIEIPDSVTSIGEWAFYICRSLTKVTIPDSVTSIGDWAFGSCDSLSSVIIGDSVTSIGYYAFYYCYSLISINFEGTVAQWNSITTEIDWMSHTIYCADGEIAEDGTVTYYSQGLKFTINSDGESYSVTGIGTCTDTDIVIPRTYNGLPVTSIDNFAFCECASLISIEIPDSVTSIGEWAFYICRSLTKVTIPDSVTSIDSEAFYGCYSLIEVINKSSLNIAVGSSDYGYIGYYAKHIITDESETAIKTIGDYVFYDDGTYIYLVKYLGSDTEITLPEYDGGKEYRILTSAFYYCKSLKSVVIGDSVTSIGDRAFYFCESLTSIIIGDSVKSVGNGAFWGCKSLTSIEIPDSVTSVGDYAFEYCKSLTSVVIGDSVTNIGEYAFYDCTSLTSIEVDSNNSYYQSIGGNLYTKDGKILIQYAIGQEATSFTIPDFTTSIGDRAFYSCESLTSIVIGNSVTSIGDRAFYFCESLTSIIIGDSVKSVGNGAFWGCYSLIEVINKSSLNIVAGSSDYGYIGYYAKHIITDESETAIKTIGDYVFYDDGTYIYLVKYLGSDTEITLPEYDGGKKYGIWQYAFYNNNTITSISIPDSVTSIGESAFSWCESLTKIVIPKSVTIIDSYAFSSCTSLTKIVIPKSVRIIDSYAFSSCTSLTIYCEATSRPIVWDSYWNYSNRPVVWGYTGE